MISDWAGETRYGELKKKVGESVSMMLTGFQKKLEEISDDEVSSLFQSGEDYANKVATAKLLEVQRAVGLRD